MMQNRPIQKANQKGQEEDADQIQNNNQVANNGNEMQHGTNNQNSSEKKQQFTIVGDKVIGNGTFGIVYQATIKETGQIVAIKKVLQDKRYKNRELSIMKEIGNHPNVIQLKHYFYTYGNDQEEVYLNVIMDFIPETLYKLIKYYYRRKKAPFPNILVKLYSYQLLRSLGYIHYMKICHRDIKPTNVLIDPRDHTLKLCDFGSAKKLIPGEPNIHYICSRYYRAPELMFGATQYSNQIDVWSAGCVIAEMLLGEPLFAGESSVDQLVQIIRVLGTPTQQDIFEMNPQHQANLMPKIKGISWKKVFKGMSADPLAIDLVSKLLVYQPNKRLMPYQALLHPYFNELRSQNCKINGNNLPDLFNFVEMEIQKQKNNLEQLVPKWYKLRSDKTGSSKENGEAASKQQPFISQNQQIIIQNENLKE